MSESNRMRVLDDGGELATAHPQLVPLIRKLIEDQGEIPIGVRRLEVVFRDDGSIDVDYGGRLTRYRPGYG